MSPLARLAKKVDVKASRNWLLLVYVAVVVSVILALAINEASKAVGS